MIKKIEKQLIELEVKENIMPEIKALIPGFLGFLLRLVFPKMEKRLITRIEDLVELILKGRKI